MTGSTPTPRPPRLPVIPSYDETAIRAFVSALMAPEIGVIEFRVLHCKLGKTGLIESTDRYEVTLSGWYDNVDALVIDIKRLKGVSGYLTINPLDRDLLARSCNKLVKARTKFASSDRDVVQLRWLFLDIDPERKADISSTEEELNAAVERRDLILAENPDLAASSFFGRSGNGCWILVRLPDYPNDSEHREYIGQTLEYLAERYSDARVKIDTATRNPSRVIGIPGTAKCKGSSLAHRPWRLATIDGGNREDGGPLAFNLATWLASRAPGAGKNGHANLKPDGARPLIPNLGSLAYIRKAFQAELDSLAGAGEGDRNIQLNASAFAIGTLVGAGVIDRSEAEQELGRIALGIGLSEVETRATIASGLTSGIAEPRDLSGLAIQANGHAGHREHTEHADQGDTPQVELAAPRQTFDFTDMGNARRLAYLHSHRIRYCKAYGDWLIYDGKRWIRDEIHTVERLAKDIPGQVLAEIPPTQDDEIIEAYKKWYMASQSKKNLDSAIKLARSEDGIAVTPRDFDKDPWALNVMNGTIDLKTGQLRPHRRDDLITKLCPVEYQPDARAPRWEQFEREIFAGDQSVVEYMRRAIGYSATALDVVQELHLLYGDGSNGKNLYLDTIRHVLGDYACQAEPNLLLATRFDSHPAGVADLQSRRFVMATETDDGRQFAEGMVKRLTGDRQIKARFMRENFFEFARTFKIFLATNAKPEVRGSDYGIWRRIRLIPFTVTFLLLDDPRPIHPPDFLRIEPGLESRLLDEAPGILALMVRGCLDWRSNGMRPPDAVIAATEGYRAEMDVVAAFIAECCTTHLGSPEEMVRNKTPPATLYQSYSNWCEANGNKPVSGRKFARDLTKKGFPFDQANSQSWRQGIKLREPEAPRGYGERDRDWSGSDCLFDETVPY